VAFLIWGGFMAEIKDQLDDHEKRISAIENNHENRITNLEDYNKEQNGKIDNIDKKLDKLMWGIGAGMFSIILMLIPIMITLIRS